jgi:pimeloyl-ACP methyl ester carboxylesterase
VSASRDSSPPPGEITFEAGGLRFAALTWPAEPRSDAPLALCLHGYPDTPWTWRHLGPRLAARGWRVVAPYMRGYAPTDLAPDGCYGIGELAADAENAHTALGGDERAALIGHDWGAVATYCVASHAPGLFRHCVALGYPAPVTIFGPLRSPRRALSISPLLLRQARASWYMAYNQIPAVSERSLGWLIPKLWELWSPGYDGTADAARALESLSGPGRRNAALRYYRALAWPPYRSPAHRDLRRWWMSVPERPILYVHGREDGCGLAAFAERTGALLGPGSRFELLPDAGHFLQLERPDAVNGVVEEFLGEA